MRDRTERRNRMSDKIHYMVEGMAELIRALDQYPDNKVFSVSEIVGISNRVYRELTKKDKERTRG